MPDESAETINKRETFPSSHQKLLQNLHLVVIFSTWTNWYLQWHMEQDSFA